MRNKFWEKDMKEGNCRMKSRSNWIITQSINGQPLVIEDVGPWDKFPTVTNDVENVVFDLFDRGELYDGRELFYIDSEGVMDEILHEEGIFKGFRPSKRIDISI